MKIVHLVSVWDGGVKTQVQSVSERFLGQGHQVVLVALRCKHQVGEIGDTDVQVVELFQSKKLSGILAGCWRALELMRSFRPDVLHAHSFHAILFARLLRLFVRVPYLVSTFHTSNNAANNLDGGRLFSSAYRITDPLTDISTNVSLESSESFVRSGALSGNRIVTIYDGFDTDRFLPRPEVRLDARQGLGINEHLFVWLAVGRLSAPKDYPTLFTAFARVACSMPETVLLVVGDGPLEAALREQIRELGMEKRIRLLGRRIDVPELMNAADAYVLSSAWEGFPNALAEAMASGLPPLATDCGGVKELVADCGWITPPQDPLALASKMCEISRLPSERRWDIGMRSRARITERFSLQHCCRVWLDLYTARVRNASDWIR